MNGSAFLAYEQVFTRIKALLRDATARTKEALWNIGQLLNRCNPPSSEATLGYALTEGEVGQAPALVAPQTYAVCCR